jgi:Asp-tRNA(Asn)/Glu-tRNA(Gln) amidotransferase A subunit family amidase
LDRITLRDPDVRAWTYIDPEAVMRQARELDRQTVKGLLHGLPIGVKDVILTCDMPTQYNSPIYYGHHPKIDAACVALLRSAGALIFGKTDTVEFAAMGRRALTANPFDFARTPGGSSSGSGAAVADCHVPVSLGTQTGGSTIRPASFCGVFAMKPTWNAVSSEGLKRYATTLDTVGWYGRSIDDLAMIAHTYALTECADLATTSQPFLMTGSRFAVFRQPVWSAAESATVDAMASGIEALREAGAIIDELALPEPFDKLDEAHSIIMNSEGASAFLSEYRSHPAHLHSDFQAQVKNERGDTKRDLLDAYDLAASCRSAFDRAASAYAAVLTPSAPGEAPLGLLKTGDSMFNRVLTLLHVPCIAIPGFVGPNGLPVGLTLTGPRYSDAWLLRVAASVAPLFARKGGWLPGSSKAAVATMAAEPTAKSPLHPR